MTNKIKACEEFWAIFIDLFSGLRTIPWKNMIGNAITGYVLVFCYNINSNTGEPWSSFLIPSCFGLILGALGLIGSIHPNKRPDEKTEITKLYDQLKQDKQFHREDYFKKSLDSIHFGVLLELIVLKIFSVFSFMIIDFDRIKVTWNH